MRKDIFSMFLDISVPTTKSYSGHPLKQRMTKVLSCEASLRQVFSSCEFVFSGKCKLSEHAQLKDLRRVKWMPLDISVLISIW